jgi:hypothetical protein
MRVLARAAGSLGVAKADAYVSLPGRNFGEKEAISVIGF